MRVIASLLALMLAACGNSSGPAPQPAPQPQPQAEWTIAFSPNMPPAMTAGTNGSWYFEFPTAPGSVHYVYKNSGPLSLGQTVWIDYSVASNAGVLVPTEGDPPARMRLFIQQQGDTLTANEPYKRWWGPGIELIPGDFAVSVVIAPQNWTSVFGARGDTVPDEFAQAIGSAAHIGFTFGGEFAGHGVYTTQDSTRFVLKGYSVQ